MNSASFTSLRQFARRHAGVAILVFAAVICAAAAGARAAGPAAGKKTTSQSVVTYVGKTGRVTASGSTTMHDWSLKSAHIKGTAKVFLPGVPGKAVAELKAISLTIPVLSLKNSDTGMVHTAHKSLRRRHDPLIIYHLVSATLIGQVGLKNPIYAFAASGNLTIAGKKRHVKLRITLVPGIGGSLSISTAVKLKMTDFGISPPTAFLGIIRSSNTVSVRAVWNLQRRVAPVTPASR